MRIDLAVTATVTEAYCQYITREGFLASKTGSRTMYLFEEFINDPRREYFGLWFLAEA